MVDNRRVVTITNHRRVRRHVTRALYSVGFDVSSCSFERAQIEAALEVRPDLIIVDLDEDVVGTKRVEEMRWLFSEVSRKYPETSSLVLTQELEHGLVIDLLEKEGLNNLVARHGGVSASQDMIDEVELIVTCQKLVTKDIFGLEKYLSTWGVKVHEHTIRSMQQRSQVVNRLEEYLHNIDCYGTIVRAVSLVADELVTNAIFNAPRNAEGEPKYGNLKRDTNVELAAGEEVALRFACDGRYVGISVNDNFGTLDRDVTMKYLCRSFNRPAEIEDKTGGAGLGLYMVFNSITQLVFNIQAGVRTEVVALFYVRSGARAFKASGRSLNLFLLR